MLRSLFTVVFALSLFTCLILSKSDFVSASTANVSPNSPPTPVADYYTGNAARQQFAPGVLINDSDPDGDSLVVSTVISQPQHGIVNVQVNGQFTYTPGQDGYLGDDSFTYLVCDPSQACTPAQVFLTTPNSPPNVTDKVFVGKSGRGRYYPDGLLSAADNDPNGDSLNIKYSPQGFQCETNPGQFMSRDTYGSFLYNPAHNYTGNDGCQFIVCDTFQACVTKTATWVKPNSAPIANADSYSGFGFSLSSIQLLGPPLLNDSDPDEDYIEVQQQNHATERGGSADVRQANGAFNYVRPYPAFWGFDSFTYTLKDDARASSPGSIYLFVFPQDGAENFGESCAVVGPPMPVVGQPINVSNGNMWIKHTDYSLPGVGENIEITRFFNSLSKRNGLFGFGWSTQYDESVETIDNKLLRLNMPDGKAVYFGRTDTVSPFTTLTKKFYGNMVVNADNSYTLTFKDGRVHRFNTLGKLISLADRNNNETTLNYDGNGKLGSIVDAFGRTLFVTTNTNGRVTALSDNLGAVAAYTYGTSNQLLTANFPDGSKYDFTYESNYGFMPITEVKDALGNILEKHQYIYQDNGQGLRPKATTSEIAGGNEKYTLSFGSGTTQVTDGLGRVTNYTYQTKGAGQNIITQVQGLCNCGGSSQTMSYEYDANLNKTKKTDGNGNITTMTYDANGNMLTETDPTGTKTYTYNAYGQVLTATDQMSGVTTVVYDANGRPTTLTDALNKSTVFTYNTTGQILTVTDAQGKVTTYTWTNANLTKIKDANLKETNFVYDSRSRLTSTVNALNYTTSYNYDLVNRLKKVTHPDTKFEEFGYDLAGRRTSVTDARGNITTFGYDNAYRLTSVTDALNHTTTFGYDLMSNRTSVTDAEGKITNTEYDTFNRVKKVVYPEITVGGIRLNEQFQYDLVGNLKKRIDTAGRETTFDYDTANRLFKTTDALGNATNFEYNARSQRTKVKDAKNQEYVFTFDALGRQLSQTNGVSTMSYEYDSVGNRTKRIDYEGRETFYHYDNLNRLHDFKYSSQNNSQTVMPQDEDWGAAYTYDNLSRLTQATNYTGNVNFQYDNRNRITQTTDVHSQILNYLYDENGNRTQLKLNNTVHTGYAYDAVNRLTTLTDDANQNFTFGYDVANKLTTKTLPNGIVTSYNYDGMNRLKELKHQQGSTVLADNNYSYNPANQISGIAELSNTKTFGYDNVDRLTSMTSPTLATENYSFDEVGNRTSSHLSSSYDYLENNRLRATETINKINYDYNGNPFEIDRSDSTTYFTWDYENRVVTANNGDEITFEYDALGRRVKRKKGSDVTKFTYDGQDVILDNANSVITKYQNGLGIDNKLKLKTNGVSKYFLQDHLGSTTALTNSSGSVIESASYDSFGNAIGNLSTRYQFTGREFDADLGLQYSRARWYSSELGRFISEDPIGFAGGDVNLYGYVHNNAVNKTDPLGLLDRGDWQIVQETTRQAPPIIAGGSAVGGGLIAFGGTSVASAPALVVGGVVLGGLGAGYAIGYYPGQWLAQKLYPNQFPQTQTSPSCDTKPISPSTSTGDRPPPTPTPTPRPERYRCTPNGISYPNGPNGPSQCEYKCTSTTGKVWFEYKKGPCGMPYGTI